MSVHLRESDRMIYFQEGDDIKIGSFQGVIDKLDGRRAIVSIGEQRMQVLLGQNFSQAQPVSSDLADLSRS